MTFSGKPGRNRRRPPLTPGPGRQRIAAAEQGVRAPTIRAVNRTAVAELLAALSYGEKVAAERARDNARFAPDARTRETQRSIGDRESRNSRLIEARLQEVGSDDLTRRFAPFFDAFFSRTEPADWVEAQTFHYVGDALVSDFADGLVDLLDPVSAEILRSALGEREDQESFA